MLGRICFSRSEPTLSQTNFRDALGFELICSINLAYSPLKSSAYGKWISSELKSAPQFPRKTYSSLAPWIRYSVVYSKDNTTRWCSVECIFSCTRHASSELTANYDQASFSARFAEQAHGPGHQVFVSSGGTSSGRFAGAF